MQPVCPNCKNPISENVFFCPTCGNKIKDPTPSTTMGSQIKIYLLSFFLPPFGLLPGIRYIRQPDQKAQIIGFVAVLLTITSVVISILIASNLMNQLNQSIQIQNEALELSEF